MIHRDDPGYSFAAGNVESRGIGAAIAERLAEAGANVAICAKSAEPHPKLPGTIHETAERVERAGGKALPFLVDVRDEDSVQHAVDQTVEKFHGIDICINNAGAFWMQPSMETEIKNNQLTKQQVMTLLSRRFDTGYIFSVKPENIELGRGKTGAYVTRIKIDYEVRKPFIAQIDLIGHFIKEIDVEPDSRNIR